MEENETWKEEYRKRAEERVIAVEAAQARIDALIARAGGPMMVVRNTQESEGEKHDNTIQELFDIADYKNGGDLAVWISELTDTIDRLEAALYNVINERDQLLADLIYAANMEDALGACNFCVHRDKAINVIPCVMCASSDKLPCFEWRGVQEVKDDDA